MKSHPLQDARARLGQIVDAALKGEPQRLTRHGRDAVVLVSEQEWLRRTTPGKTLGQLLAESPLEPGDIPPRQPIQWSDRDVFED